MKNGWHRNSKSDASSTSSVMLSIRWKRCEKRIAACLHRSSSSSNRASYVIVILRRVVGIKHHQAQIIVFSASSAEHLFFVVIVIVVVVKRGRDRQIDADRYRTKDIVKSLRIACFASYHRHHRWTHHRIKNHRRRAHRRHHQMFCVASMKNRRR